MSIQIDLGTRHHVVAANAHYYKEPTSERYIDRVLKHHDFIYLIEGSWSITECEQEYPLKAGDVLLLSAGRHHYTRRPCESGTKTFCIHVTCSPKDNESLKENLPLATLIHTQGNPKIKGYFEEIVTAHWSEHPHKHLQMSALLDLLFLELEQMQKQQISSQTDLAEKAIQMITAAPHRRYTTKEVAEKLYISTKTLDSAMQRKTGMSFYTYQKNCKLEMAALQLITEPDLPLHEIAVTLGFYDEFHMSKAFKQKYGMSPKEYRKLQPQG